MQKHILIGRGVAILLLLCLSNAHAENALFINELGDVGVGTSEPKAQLHVFSNTENARLTLQEEAAERKSRVLLHLINNGNPIFRFTDKAPGENHKSTNFSMYGGAGHFAISHIGGDRKEFIFKRNGDLVIDGALVETSDRAAKTDIEPVDYEEISYKLARLPLSEWKYKSNPSAAHIGPMAQDFKAIFGYGDDETVISARDMAGVSLAVSKSLMEVMRRQEMLISSQQEIIDQLIGRVAALEGRAASVGKN